MKIKKKNKILLYISSSFAGIINGIFSTGGAIVSIFTLNKLLKVEKKKAHATSIFIALVFSILSSYNYVISNKVDVFSTLYIILGGIIGDFLG